MGHARYVQHTTSNECVKLCMTFQAYIMGAGCAAENKKDVRQ